MADINYAELDPGIRDVVKFLNDHGWNTIDSGDGISKQDACGADFRVFPCPHVIVDAVSAEGLLNQAYALRTLLRSQFNPAWEVDGSFSTKVGEPNLLIAHLGDL